MAQNTLQQYNTIVEKCKAIFIKKTQDYGTSWRILRPTSLTDQMFIKAKRIRSIEETGMNKVGEGIEGEFKALVNYGIMALIQLEINNYKELNLSVEHATELYDKHLDATRNLMLAKNHDYGEAWRDMRISSITDLILVKLFRIKQIEDNQGQTLISEGVSANYQDIINYAIFVLIRKELEIKN